MSLETTRGPSNATAQVALVAMAAAVCAVVQILGSTPPAAADGMTLSRRTLESTPQPERPAL